MATGRPQRHSLGRRLAWMEMWLAGAESCWSQGLPWPAPGCRDQAWDSCSGGYGDVMSDLWLQELPLGSWRFPESSAVGGRVGKQQACGWCV